MCILPATAETPQCNIPGYVFFPWVGHVEIERQRLCLLYGAITFIVKNAVSKVASSANLLEKFLQGGCLFGNLGVQLWLAPNIPFLLVRCFNDEARVGSSSVWSGILKII